MTKPGHGEIRIAPLPRLWPYERWSNWTPGFHRPFAPKTCDPPPRPGARQKTACILLSSSHWLLLTVAREAGGSVKMDAAPKVQGVNYLEEILAVKRAEIERMRPLAQRYAAEALAAENFRGFTAALQRSDEQLAIIGEVKKVSPSAGLIEPNYDAALKAQEYVSQGAEAISVLTDKKFFQGSMADLVAVRDAVSVPVLRKDFILDEIQVAQSAAAGADAILLIVAALSQEELVRLVQVAAEYHIDTLVEVHSEEELDRAMGVGATLIGINNRDLHTFEIDLSITETLCELVPNDVVLVSESGYKTMEDVGRAHRSTVDAILVGEALMRGEITIEQLRSVREL